MNAGTVPVLRARAITKSFGTVTANDRVDFELNRGEIHALVGENGAGKSTLMNMLYGMFRPDSGDIELDGVPADFQHVDDAIAAGIGMVHQHFMLVPEFTVEQNITLGAEPRKLGFIDRKVSARAIQEPMRLIGFQIDPKRRAQDLSLAEQQRVEILKVLYRGAKIIILDEPTAILAPQETEELFKTLRSLASHGVAVIFITHKLWEVMEVADRVTVLRAGATHGTFPVDTIEIPDVVALMTGRTDVGLGRTPRSRPARPDRLVAANLRGRQTPDCAVDAVSFSIRGGEILGIAGVDGNGQNSLVALLTGVASADTGELHLDGVDIAQTSLSARRERGIAYVPEDRHRDGLPVHASVIEGLAGVRLASRHGISVLKPAISRSLTDWARGVVDRYGIKTASIRAAASSLSGGNQQKIVLARELETRPKLMVMAQPTRGVDIGAAEGIYAAIDALAAEGAAVVVVSADLDELLRIADRILVLYRGGIAADFDANTVSREQLGAAMTGGNLREAA